MRLQRATTVVSLPLPVVEDRLRDVESWSDFLHGVGSIRFTSHERYLFTLAEGRDHRQVKMVVRLRPRDHTFVWHTVGGAGVRGALRLRVVDDRHTSVTLEMATLPPDFRAGLADLLMPGRDTALVDVQQLDRVLSRPARRPGHSDASPRGLPSPVGAS